MAVVRRTARTGERGATQRAASPWATTTGTAGASRAPQAVSILFTNTNSQSVSYHEPRKSAPQFVLIYGTITIDSLYRHFEFVLLKHANRD